MTPREALASMRRASANHLLSSAEQGKLLAVAEAALAARDATRVQSAAARAYREARWGKRRGEPGAIAAASAAYEGAKLSATHARKALKAALAALASP